MIPRESLHFAVCTDRTDRLPQVFDHVGALSVAARARLSLLHILETGVGAAEQATTSESLSNFLRRQPVRAAPVVSTRLKDERTSDAIARVAAQLQTSLIALDSHDLSMLRHVVRGSTAMEVVSAAATPVMVASSKIQPPRSSSDYHMVIASDGSRTSDAIFSTLGDLIGLLAVRVTLVQVYEPRLGDEGELREMESCEQRLDALRPRLPATANIDCHVGMTEGLESVPHAILRVANDLRADAIAMATQGETAAHHVLVGSVALAITQHSTVPVILARGLRH